MPEPDVPLSEITALISELGITRGQLKGRLLALRKWEQRAKAFERQAEDAEYEVRNLKHKLSLATNARAASRGLDPQIGPGARGRRRSSDRTNG